MKKIIVASLYLLGFLNAHLYSMDQYSWFGIHSIQGSRPNQEDFCIINNDNDYYYGGVFDGHNGYETAQYLTIKLFPSLLKKFKNADEIDARKQLIVDTCKRVDKKILNLGLKGGSTAACFIIIKNLLFTFNVGDSRLLLLSKDKNPEVSMLSVDHTVESENKRLLITCLKKDSEGIYRLHGKLNMARSFGDNELKKCGCLIATPEVFVQEISENDYGLLLFTDGILEPLNNNRYFAMRSKSLSFLDRIKLQNKTIADIAKRNHACSPHDVARLVIANCSTTFENAQRKGENQTVGYIKLGMIE